MSSSAQSLATDGDIVVALVDEESATIKRWRPHGPTVTLGEPAQGALAQRLLWTDQRVMWRALRAGR